MATTFAQSPLQTSSRQQFLTPHSPPQQQRRLVSRQRFIQDFSQCLFEFVIQLLPTAEEMAVKEDVRKLLERLIRTIEPDSRLLSFGSSANGFSLKNSGASILSTRMPRRALIALSTRRHGFVLSHRLRGAVERIRSCHHGWGPLGKRCVCC